MGPLPPDWFLRVRLKLRHLQLFVALDKQPNLRRAANDLGISQPAASKLLNDVETRLGTPLFERHSRGLTPNWYGELMIRRAHAILDELHFAGEEFNAFQAGNTGLVRVGTVMAPAVGLLTSAIELVHADFPGLKVNVRVDTSRALIPGLLAGDYDFVISRIPVGFSGDRFVFEEVGEERICFVCSRAHPLSGSTKLDLGALIDYPWTLQPPGTLMRQRVDDLFRHCGVEFPRRVVDTPDLLVSLALVSKSGFITVTTRQVADLLCAPERFCILPLSENLSVQPYGLVSLRHKRLSPGTGILMSTLRQLMAEPEALTPSAP